MKHALRCWGSLLVLLAVVLGWALASGSASIAWSELPRLLFQADGSPEAEVLQRLRLPRALAAVATGGLLALSGALMQVLLRNPLAEPYVLGLSSTAAVGALGMMALGFGTLAVNAAAFVGALVAVVLVFALARHDMGRIESASVVDGSPRLLLTGVMISSLSIAVVSLILTLAPTERLRGMLFWMLGDLSGTGSAALALGLLPLLLAGLMPFTREMNLLLRGPGPALMLGVPVKRLRAVIYVAASLAAAVTVTTAGAIGFVGLVVPHVLRLVIGNDQRVLLPACALGGGVFLLAADTAARSWWAPQQLPVGALTALVGAPLFIVLLSRDRSRRRG